MFPPILPTAVNIVPNPNLPGGPGLTVIRSEHPGKGGTDIPFGGYSAMAATPVDIKVYLDENLDGKIDGPPLSIRTQGGGNVFDAALQLMNLYPEKNLPHHEWLRRIKKVEVPGAEPFATDRPLVIKK